MKSTILKNSECPTETGGSAIVGFGQRLRRPAIEVQVIAELPVKILGNSKLVGGIEIEARSAKIGHAWIHSSIGQKVRCFEAEEIQLSAHYTLCGVSRL